MAIKSLLAGGDESQGLLLLTATSGSVAASTTQAHTGSYSYLFDSTVSNVVAHTTISTTQQIGRRSLWIYVPAYFTGNTTDIFVLRGTASIGCWRLRSDGKIGWTNSSSLADVVTGTTVLSTGAWHRLAFCWNITSQAVNSFKTYIDDVEETALALTNTGLFQADVTVTTERLGLVSNAPGASKTIYFDDLYLDDTNALTDPGEIRVTAKQYVGTSEGASTNAYDTNVGTAVATMGSRYLALSERPNSDSNGRQHAATSAAYEKFLLQAASAGDADLTGTTILGWTAWVRVKTAASSSASSITDNDVDTTISTTTTIATFTHITTSATYPTGRFGVKSTGAATDSFVYEGGVLVGYTPAAVGGVTGPAVGSLALLGVGT